MKKLFAILSVVAIAMVTLVSCNNKEVALDKLLRVTPTPNAVVLAAGETATITLAFTPETEARDVVWETSDETIATVSGGVITGVKAGAAVIRAVAGSIVAVVSVDVFGGGNSAWSLIGTVHGSNWDTDYVGEDKEGYVLFDHVPLAKGDLFKIRKNKDWADNRGGLDTFKNAAGTDVDKTKDELCTYAVGTPFAAVANGYNLTCGANGFYDIYYIAEKEALLVLDAGAELPADKDIPSFLPSEAVTIDGKFEDWAEVTAVTGDGINAALKVIVDDNNVYVYSKRTTERMDEIWGGNAYFYYSFDLDNNAETGVELWGNGPYEMLLVLYPFAGSADAPAFGIAKDGAAAPETSSVNNAVIAGAVSDSGVETEIAIPRADIETLTPSFKVYSWGNKGASDKLEFAVTL